MTSSTRRKAGIFGVAVYTIGMGRAIEIKKLELAELGSSVPSEHIALAQLDATIFADSSLQTQASPSQTTFGSALRQSHQIAQLSNQTTNGSPLPLSRPDSILAPISLAQVETAIPGSTQIKKVQREEEAGSSRQEQITDELYEQSLHQRSASAPTLTEAIEKQKQNQRLEDILKRSDSPQSTRQQQENSAETSVSATAERVHTEHTSAQISSSPINLHSGFEGVAGILNQVELEARISEKTENALSKHQNDQIAQVSAPHILVDTSSLVGAEDDAGDVLAQVSMDEPSQLAQTSVKIILNDPLTPDRLHWVVLLSCLSIVACCACTTLCVRVSRDCRIKLNAVNIKRQYYRRMQLYLLMKAKLLMDRSNEYLGAPEADEDEDKSLFYRGGRQGDKEVLLPQLEPQERITWGGSAGLQNDNEGGMNQYEEEEESSYAEGEESELEEGEESEEDSVKEEEQAAGEKVNPKPEQLLITESEQQYKVQVQGQ